MWSQLTKKPYHLSLVLSNVFFGYPVFFVVPSHLHVMFNAFLTILTGIVVDTQARQSSDLRCTTALVPDSHCGNVLFPREGWDDVNRGAMARKTMECWLMTSYSKAKKEGLANQTNGPTATGKSDAA